VSIKPGVTTNVERSLADLVDDLTRPKTVANWQGKRLARRVDPPMLDALQEAVASNVGGTGSGKPGRERVPLDLGALDLIGAIDERVRAWLDELGARPGRDVTTTQALRSWFVLWSAGEKAHERQLRAVLEGWVASVGHVLDPPRRIELGGSDPVPCPRCGEEWVLNGHRRLGDDEVDVNEAAWARAVAVYEHGSIEESFAACAACTTRWEGVDGMRALRIEIDDAEAARKVAEVKS
jgi:hypothetical protein